MENKNKNIWISAIVVILIIIILVAGIWFFDRDKNKEIVEKEQQNSSGKISSLSSLDNLNNTNIILQNNTYYIMSSLNKTKCSGIKDEKQNLICINGIDLIEKAISANNLSVCLDKSADVDSETIILCRMIVNKRRMIS